jgi:hypothetical protein
MSEGGAFALWVRGYIISGYKCGEKLIISTIFSIFTWVRSHYSSAHVPAPTDLPVQPGILLLQPLELSSKKLNAALAL